MLEHLEKNEKHQLFTEGKTIMNTLVNSINGAVSNAVSNYTKTIAKKFNLDEDELMELWNNVDMATETKAKPKPKAKPKTSDSEDDKPGRPAGSSTCPYIYKKGDKQNKACGAKSRAGFVYCSAHKKFEGEDPKPGKVLPNPLKRVSKKSSDVPPANVPKVIRTNKQLNVVWNPDTRMVFRSIHDRVVHARVVDGVVTPLTDDDREICKKWGFQYTEEDEVKSNSDLVKSDQVKSDDSEDEEPQVPVKSHSVKSHSDQDDKSEFNHSRKLLKKAIGIEDELTSEEEDD